MQSKNLRVVLSLLVASTTLSLASVVYAVERGVDEALMKGSVVQDTASVGKDVVEEKGAKGKDEALETQGNIETEQATTQMMQAQIENTNNQAQQVLSSVNSSITSAGSTLGEEKESQNLQG